MNNIKLTIAYDGTGYHGWQIQPERPTIQGALTEAAERIAQEPLTLHGAGRTDAGVHAWGQVVNFETHARLEPGDWQRALNAVLPPAIRIRAAENAIADFHARWLARAKTYQYRIYRGPVAPPFRWRYVLHDPHALDFAAMAEAARCFEGEHDFTSFAASSGSEEEDREKTMLRAVYRSEMIAAGAARSSPLGSACELSPGAEEWLYVIRGRSFLRHMVRKIVGTILEAGRGRLRPAEIPGLFDLRDRTQSGPTAPAHGLCLMSVEYPGAAPSAATNDPASVG